MLCVGRLGKVGLFLLVSFPPNGRVEVRTNDEGVGDVAKRLIARLVVRN